MGLIKNKSLVVEGDPCFCDFITFNLENKAYKTFYPSDGKKHEKITRHDHT